MTMPFSVTSSEINSLSDIQLTQLLNELLHAEASKFGIPHNSVEVALNIRVGDGGEDGRIEWCGAVEKTDYLPNRLTMFQNKATTMTASGYAAEITRSAVSEKPSEIKPKVDEVLGKNGCYIVFTTQELNNLQKHQRISAVRDRLNKHSKSYAESCDIRIYDASVIASWTNLFITAIVSVQQWGGKSTARGLKNYFLWSQHESLSKLEFLETESRRYIQDSLTAEIHKPRSCFRLTGLSGLGKTRTIFQIFHENEQFRSLVVYIDAADRDDLQPLISDWVSLDLKAILVVDNCDYRLHERLRNEVTRSDSKLTLLTIDYNFETVSSITKCFKLEQMSDDEISKLILSTYKNQLPDLDRIAVFAQGFPQMAVLVAEARISDDPRIGVLTEDELAEKLLWNNSDAANNEHLNILQVCSLFDFFGIEMNIETELQFIADTAEKNIDEVYECIQIFSRRGIIDRRGRFGQLVPKPLAIRLAAQWWNKTRPAKQQKLIDDLPDEMMEAFCNQIEKLDSHPNVKELTKKLCGLQGPFGRAEVILSSRGSRLFRSLVNVNSESTAKALYLTLYNLEHQELKQIDNTVRRNLVIALERLCYHEDTFDKTAWCMLLLASAENESWNNNATGLFSQLYSVRLSGTAAKPQARFLLLKRALNLKSSEVDMVLLKALKCAVNTQGGHRASGAEFQGTKEPLKEWHPTLWGEIFNYWEEAFGFLLILFKRGENQRKEVLSIIGNSIRNFAGLGRIEMLNEAIMAIVKANGVHWPSALSSIRFALKYDSEKLNQEGKDALENWLERLNPKNASLPEKLKVVVIAPPWDHDKSNDGKYVDRSEKKAKELALIVSNSLDEFYPHLSLLLQGDQRQSYSFGYVIASKTDSIPTLLDATFKQLETIDRPNLSFLYGCYQAIYEESAEKWDIELKRILRSTHLTQHYAEFLRTGEIRKHHLQQLLELVAKGTLEAESVKPLAYCSYNNKTTPQDVADFCITLSKADDQSQWPAFVIIYGYCYNHNDANIVETLRNQLKQLVTTVPIDSNQKKQSVTEAFQWHNLIQKLLKKDDMDLAAQLTNQILLSAKVGFDFGDLLEYVKQLMSDLFKQYSETLWPIFANAVIESKGFEKYWLQQLLVRDTGFSDDTPNALSVVPVKLIIDWCKAAPDSGPLFIASCVTPIENKENKENIPSKLFIALLENFGRNENVSIELKSSLRPRSWIGSLIPYLESNKAVLKPLLEHSDPNVSGWVTEYITELDRAIEHEKNREQERELGIY